MQHNEVTSSTDTYGEFSGQRPVLASVQGCSDCREACVRALASLRRDGGTTETTIFHNNEMRDE